MPKTNRIGNILLWSLIAAAFIGPGTVTTASAAGSNFGYGLIWTILFSIMGCLILQEASARITIASGQLLPELLMKLFKDDKTGKWFGWFVGISVIIGCMAYQAGNMVGAISGLNLIRDFPKELYLIGLTLFISILLFSGRYKVIANILSIAVGLMGLSFFILVFFEDHSISEMFSGLIPSAPAGSGWIILGLIGTTIVPYNLFLGSGLSKGQSLQDMRLGLAVSVVLGGLITVAILVNGSLVEGEFSFEALGNQLSRETGSYGIIFLGIGLAAAGLTSSVTSPLAGGIIARGLFPSLKNKVYHLTWLIIVLTGLVFGLIDVRPVPLIILAQALNGLILPLVAIALFILVNHPKIMGKNIPGWIYNGSFILVLGVSVFIGINNLSGVVEKYSEPLPNKVMSIILITLILLGVVIFKVFRIRKQP